MTETTDAARARRLRTWGSRLWLSARHLVAFAVTVLALVALAFVAVTPIVAVFVVDGAELTSDDAGTALVWVAGVVAVAVVAGLVVAPVGALLEYLARRAGRAGLVLAALLPVALVGAIAVGAFAVYQVFVDPAGTYVESTVAYYAAMGAELVLLALLVYWVSLWALTVAGGVVRWGVRRYRRSRALPGTDVAPPTRV